MAAGNVPDGEGHRQNGEAKGQRNTQEPDADVRKSGRQNGAAQPPKTSQKVPKNSAPNFLIIILSPFKLCVSSL